MALRWVDKDSEVYKIKNIVSLIDEKNEAKRRVDDLLDNIARLKSNAERDYISKNGATLYVQNRDDNPEIYVPVGGSFVYSSYGDSVAVFNDRQERIAFSKGVVSYQLVEIEKENEG